MKNWRFRASFVKKLRYDKFNANLKWILPHCSQVCNIWCCNHLAGFFFQKKSTFCWISQDYWSKETFSSFFLNILVSFLFRGPKVGSQNIALIFALHWRTSKYVYTIFKFQFPVFIFKTTHMDQILQTRVWTNFLFNVCNVLF